MKFLIIVLLTCLLVFVLKRLLRDLRQDKPKKKPEAQQGSKFINILTSWIESPAQKNWAIPLIWGLLLVPILLVWAVISPTSFLEAFSNKIFLVLFSAVIILAINYGYIGAKPEELWKREGYIWGMKASKGLLVFFAALLFLMAIVISFGISPGSLTKKFEKTKEIREETVIEQKTQEVVATQEQSKLEAEESSYNKITIDLTDNEKIDTDKKDDDQNKIIEDLEDP